jgi:hypothetical protein
MLRNASSLPLDVSIHAIGVARNISALEVNGASPGAVRGGNPGEAFAKGGDSDERRGAPSLVSGGHSTIPRLRAPLLKVIGYM